MTSTGRIAIVSGGQRFTYALSDEFTHIGRSADNHIILDDPELEDHQASIACREGRFAIYSPLDQRVEVNGVKIPAEQWTRLTDGATIRMSPESWFRFVTSEVDANASAEPTSGAGTASANGSGRAGNDSNSNAAATAKKSGASSVTLPINPSDSKTVVSGSDPGAKKYSRRKKSGPGGSSRTSAQSMTGRVTARFITDQKGDIQVQLGEDCHLPELSLQEGTAQKAAATKKGEGSNPMLVYAALGFSVLMSLVMLLVEVDMGQEGPTNKRAARQNVIREYVGKEEASSGTEPLYQSRLRTALLAQARVDIMEERRCYTDVLRLLNAEDRNRFTGVTGSPERDERLRGLLAVLLAQ